MIRLAALTCRLGGRTVLAGVEARVRRGELLAVCGPNGAGKSTLLRCAAGLLPPAAGEALLEGRPVGRWPRRERARRLAYLPQRLALAFPATLRQVVAGGRYPHRHPFTGADPEGRAAVARALAAVELAELADRPFATLSGGEQQRGWIAAALAQAAGALLLDEPTAALDPPHGRRLFRLLRRLAAAGHAVAVVTHDLNLAAAHAHRILLLAEGRVAAAGPPGAVLTEANLAAAYGPGLVVGRHPAAALPVVVPAP